MKGFLAEQLSRGVESGSGDITPLGGARRARSACFLVLLSLVLAVAGCTAPVTVEWSTETEINTAGFNLFRGESPGGPFPVKVNEQLIPPAADPLTGGKHSFVDRTTQVGVVYYYQWQEVEKNGGINTFGPIRVQAVGLDWRHVLVLIPLALGVLALWLLGGKRATAPRQAPETPGGNNSTQG